MGCGSSVSQLENVKSPQKENIEVQIDQINESQSQQLDL